jgi:hypothetical protein
VALLDYIQQKITRIRFLRLKGELLESSSPEISADKVVLRSRLETLGFPPKIVKALDSADRQLTISLTDLEFKQYMDLLRTVFEELVEESARKSVPASRPYTFGGGHFQPYKQYLQNEGIISGDEAEVIQKLYNYLSNAGAHSLGTSGEQARVCRASIIEWSLLLVGRVQERLAPS